ncbi:MAG TPA: Fe-S cluster assembly protein SufD [Blastocatellia bacterium]|nr:Fe-S cluster assembly protein SufD [Blastocatellia bacterium]
MSGVKEKENLYVTDFDRELKNDAKKPAWLGSIKESAFKRFLELGFPTTRLENWKYTNASPIATTPFALGAPDLKSFDARVLETAPLGDLDCARIVVIDGVYAGTIGGKTSNNSAVRVESLAKAIAEEDPIVTKHLTRYANYTKNAFAALNTAFIKDGVALHIPDGAIVEDPIYILFVSTGNGPNGVSHPRALVTAGRDCQATVIQGFIGFGSEKWLTNAVTEIVIGENSRIDHFNLQDESRQAYHVATLQVNQGRSSGFHTHSIALGGALVRNDVNDVLDGEGAEATLDGLYVETGDQFVDNHTLIDHAQPHCSSREVYKGILDGKAKGVFDGSIIVRKDAQKTDARQSNKNLLLSGEAEINTKPQLEIFADDVKCSHGATIGQIDQESIFYLRSRGIDLESARSIMMYAFANEILDRIKSERLRSKIGKAVFARLSGERRLIQEPVE